MVAQIYNIPSTSDKINESQPGGRLACLFVDCPASRKEARVARKGEERRIFWEKFLRSVCVSIVCSHRDT